MSAGIPPPYEPLVEENRFANEVWYRWFNQNASSTGREVLTANRTYYVRTDGSDSNDGFVDSAAGAFLTIQQAINTTAALDLSTFSVTIQVGAGTYTGAVTVTAPWVGSGNVTLRGDPTTPSNVIMSVAGDNCIAVSGAGRLRVTGIKFTTTGGAGSGVLATSSGRVNFTGQCEFGAIAGTAGIATQTNGYIEAVGINFTISGGAASWLASGQNGTIVVVLGTTTLTGTPAFSTAFCTCSSSSIWAGAITFSGGATGTRYSATLNGVIDTSGGGANYFPGSVAGSTATGGQYA